MFTLDKFTPMNNRVLIKIDEATEADIQETKSGLLIVNKNKPKGRNSLATIVKLGSHMMSPDGKHQIPLDSFLHVGDKIMYYNPSGKGMHFEIDGEDYILIRAEDIDCIVEDDKEVNPNG